MAAAFPQVPAAIADAFARPNGQDAALGPASLFISILFLFTLRDHGFLHGQVAVAGPRSGGRRYAPVPARLAGSVFTAVWFTAFLIGLLLGYAILRPSHPAVVGSPDRVCWRRWLTVFITDLVIRFLCAPDHPDRRLLPWSTQGARSIHRIAVVTAMLTAATLGLAQLLGACGYGQ